MYCNWATGAPWASSRGQPVCAQKFTDVKNAENVHEMLLPNATTCIWKSSVFVHFGIEYFWAFFWNIYGHLWIFLQKQREHFMKLHTCTQRRGRRPTLHPPPPAPSRSLTPTHPLLEAWPPETTNWKGYPRWNTTPAILLFVFCVFLIFFLFFCRSNSF